MIRPLFKHLAPLSLLALSFGTALPAQAQVQGTLPLQQGMPSLAPMLQQTMPAVVSVLRSLCSIRLLSPSRMWYANISSPSRHL